MTKSNLNIGCPSERVKSGAFGACFNARAELVGDCVAAMKARVEIPVTVKCRTGIDDQDPEAALGLLAERVVRLFAMLSSSMQGKRG